MIRINLQLFANKKGVGSSKNGRESFARDVASRIIFLDGGKIIEDGTPEKVIKHSRHAKVRSFFEALAN